LLYCSRLWLQSEQAILNRMLPADLAGPLTAA